MGLKHSRADLMTLVKAASVFWIVTTPCIGYGKVSTIADFVKANGYPTIVASSTELVDGTLFLYGARKISGESKLGASDIEGFRGKTLVYIRKRDEVAKLRSVGLTGVPNLSYDKEVLDLVYNLIPPIVANLRKGEIIIAKVSLGGTVVASEPTEVKILRFPPASAGGHVRDPEQETGQPKEVKDGG